MNSLATKSSSPIARVGTFLELIKFAHTIFALPFALVAAALAYRAVENAPPTFSPGVKDSLPSLLGLILVCMVAARTFAMTLNRLVDRQFDALNPRTALRPSVTGAVSPNFMRGVIILCVSAFTVSAYLFYVWFNNPWPAAFSMPVLLWLGLYSFTKRFTAFCHFWLGASLGLAPVCAWIAIVPPHGPVLTPLPVLLGLGVLFWVAGFDILYALPDEQIDRASALHSIPAAFGRPTALWISRFCHLLTILAFVGVGLSGELHLLYWIATALAAALLAIEQSLVRAADISKVNVAFMTVNGIVGVLFGTLAILDVLLN